MDNTLRNGLVQLAARSCESLLCALGIASGDCLTGLANEGLQLGLDSLVAKTSLLVGENALLLRLDVCQ